MRTPDSVPEQVPEHSRSERYIALAIFVLSFLYLCLLRRYSWVDPDEGIILQGAQRIVDGQVLYRDFFSFFTPGSYYLFALVSRVFGDSYLVAHTALAFIGAGFSPITYLLARRVCARQPSLLVTGLMTITALPLRFVVIHNWDSTLWACLALYCAVRLLETPNASWAFAAASFTSLTTLFEQSKGAGLVLGLVTGFVIIIIALSDRQPKIFSRNRLMAISLGLAWPFLVVIVYFTSQHALGIMLRDWIWPLQHYSSANRVPFGYENLTESARREIFETGPIGTRVMKLLVFAPSIWVPVLPFFAVVLLLRLAIQKLRGRAVCAEWGYYVLISASISGLLISVLIVRKESLHFVYLQPIFFLVLAWLLDGRSIRSPRFKALAPILGLCLSMSLLALGATQLIRVRAENTIVTRRGVLETMTKDTVAEYIQAHVDGGEPILIYPYQSTYYFLTRTHSPTSYEYYQPGMHTSQQMEEMLSEFEAHPTRAVLFEPSFSDHIHNSWPNTPMSALVRDPMADYIARNYRVCTTLSSPSEWYFLFMMRNDLACPK